MLKLFIISLYLFSSITFAKAVTDKTIQADANSEPLLIGSCTPSQTMYLKDKVVDQIEITATNLHSANDNGIEADGIEISFQLTDGTLEKTINPSLIAILDENPTGETTAITVTEPGSDLILFQSTADYVAGGLQHFFDTELEEMAAACNLSPQK